MADQWYGTPSGRGERWNVNLPAVVGVVFVFLLGVVVWVVATSGGDDDAIESAGTVSSTTPTTVATSVTTPTVPPSTSPQPMPVTTAPGTPPPTVPPAPGTVTLTVPPATAPPAPPPPPPPTDPAPTAAPVAPTTAAPLPANGDLGVVGHPIRKPACDGGYITVVASAVGDDATAEGIGRIIDEYDGSSYLRTDQTCPSLTPSVDGEPIYVVYLGPFSLDADACRARSDGPAGAYVRRLSNDLGPNHSVDCP